MPVVALEPCPFCGGPARQVAHHSGPEATCGGAAGCPGGDVLASPEAWNRRAPAAPQSAP